MENAKQIQKNYKVDVTFFAKKNEIWIQCKSTFHLQSTDIVNALCAALNKLEISAWKIEDAKIEREL